MALILNVDDNEAIRYARTKALKRAGFNVVEAPSAEAALALLVEKRPDAVLLDIFLPDGNGIEVCREIKSNTETASTPVIHISAIAVEAGAQIEGLSIGADLYLVEPVSPGVLAASVRSVIRARRAEQEVRLLFDIAAELLVSERSEHVIDRVWSELSRIADLSACFFHRVEPRASNMRLSRCWGLDEAAAKRFETMESLTASPELLRELGLTESASFPLLAQSKLIGSMCFARREAVPFTNQDIAVLQSVCNQIAAATERQEAEAALRAVTAEATRRAEEAEEGRNILQTLMDHANEGIAIAGGPPDFPIIARSRHATQLTGRTTEDLNSNPGTRHVFKSDGITQPAEHELPIYRATRHGEVITNEEWIIERSDGKRATVLTNVSPVRNSTGAIVGAVSCFRDVTALKNAEMEAREKERQFRTIAELVPDLIWSSSPDGQRTWHNQRWWEYTGQSTDEAKGCGWLEVIHPDDRRRAVDELQQSVVTREPLRQERRIRSKDGEYRWFLVQIHPVRNDAGDIVQWFGAATDIHEHRTMLDTQQRQLERSHEELRAAAIRILTVQEDERRRFARELHDNAVQQLALLEIELDDILKGRPAPGDAMNARLETLKRRIGSLSGELRGLSYQLHPSMLDHLGLEAALRRLIEDFAERWPAPVDYASYGVPDGLPPDATTALYRIAQEALRNVTKHAWGSRVHVRLAGRGSRVCMSIKDTGPGFDINGNGTRGLGLISMSERLRPIGGTLKVRSRRGGGTRISAHIAAPPPANRGVQGTAVKDNRTPDSSRRS
jgi:PAS domain S-box-containing protein